MPYNPVDTAPVLVDASLITALPFTLPAWHGPVTTADGTIWLGAATTDDPVLGDGFAMFYSTDGGETWTRTGFRASGSGTLTAWYAKSFLWDGGDNWLLLESCVSAAEAVVSSFSMTTGTWTEVTRFSVADGISLACLSRLSTGNLVCIYIPWYGTRCAYARAYNGSTWSTAVRVGSDIEEDSSVHRYLEIAPVIATPDDVTHAFFRVYDWSSNTKLYYAQISSTGSVLLDPAAASPVDSPSGAKWPDGIYVPETGELVLTREQNLSGTHTIGVVRGAVPGSGTPITLTFEQIDTASGAGSSYQFMDPRLARSLTGSYSTLVVMAATEDPSPGLMRIYQQPIGGVWDAGATYWNPATLPPSLPIGFTFGYVEMISGTITSATRLDFYMAGLVQYPVWSWACGIVLAGHSGAPVIVTTAGFFPEYIKRRNLFGH